MDQNRFIKFQKNILKICSSKEKIVTMRDVCDAKIWIAYKCSLAPCCTDSVVYWLAKNLNFNLITGEGIFMTVILAEIIIIFAAKMASVALKCIKCRFFRHSLMLFFSISSIIKKISVYFWLMVSGINTNGVFKRIIIRFRTPSTLISLLSSLIEEDLRLSIKDLMPFQRSLSCKIFEKCFVLVPKTLE